MCAILRVWVANSTSWCPKGKAAHAYQTEDGTDTNRIESFFARAERSYDGIHHRFSVKYPDWYMAMVAWKEDTRHMALRWPRRRAAYGHPPHAV